MVHSLFAFFRDSASFAVYEWELTRFGVRIVFVTLQTASVLPAS